MQIEQCNKCFLGFPNKKLHFPLFLPAAFNGGKYIPDLKAVKGVDKRLFSSPYLFLIIIFLF